MALELTFNKKIQCCPQLFLRCTEQACCLDVSADVADTITEHLLPEPKTVLAGMEMLAQLVTDEVTSKQVGHGCWADAMLASLSCQIWELEKQGYIAWVPLITGGICSVGRPRGQALQVQEQPAG